MKSNANMIVIVVAAVLAVLMLAFVISSGSCSGGGGGGGAAPASTSGATSASASVSASSSASSISATSASGYSENATVDDLKALIDADTAPVGSNARSASGTPGALSVAQAYQELAQRGFDGIKLKADFGPDGSYIAADALDPSSSDVYPVYQADYLSSADVLWVINITGGAVSAAPLGTASATLPGRVVLTESDVIVQYNSVKNEFSDFALNDYGAVAGKKVDRIDKQTLDAYTFDALGRL